MAVFGNENVEVTQDYPGTEYLCLCKFTLPVNGLVSKLTGYWRSGAYPRHAKGLIYADSAGYPGARVGLTPEVDVEGTWGWKDWTFPSPLDLAAGDYWLGYISDENTAFRKVGGAANQLTKKEVLGGYASPPATYPGGGAQTAEEMSVYATYEPSANPFPVDWLIKSKLTGYACFLNQYLKAKVLGLDPLKLPDGTVW